METSSIYIGVAIILLFIIPIIYLIIAQNKKQKAKTNKLYEISKLNNLTPDVLEITDMLVLGLDTSAKKLVIVEPLNNDHSAVINLEDVKSAKIKTSSASQKENSYLYVSMELLEKASGKKIFEMVFYDDEVDLNLDPDAELLRAKKWHEILGRNL